MSENYGIKVTLPGNDVLTDTDIKHFMLNSKYQVLKTYIVNTASFSIANESYSQSNHNIITVNHALGYKPMCVMYWKTGSIAGADLWMHSNAGADFESIVWNVDTSNFKIDYIYVNGITGLAGTSWTFKFYIFANQGLP